MKINPYKKFYIMLTVSFLIMYFVMFLNVASFSHIYMSLTRIYMVILMVSAMSISMILFMRKMYKDKKKNNVIIICSILIFILTLFLLRTQAPIEDKQYMKAMIPHHSSAILTSENAKIKDPEVKELAENIITTQKEEIAQMKYLLERIK